MRAGRVGGAVFPPLRSGDIEAIVGCAAWATSHDAISVVMDLYISLVVSRAVIR